MISFVIIGEIRVQGKIDIFVAYLINIICYVVPFALNRTPTPTFSGHTFSMFLWEFLKQETFFIQHMVFIEKFRIIPTDDGDK